MQRSAGINTHQDASAPLCFQSCRPAFAFPEQDVSTLSSSTASASSTAARLRGRAHQLVLWDVGAVPKRTPLRVALHPEVLIHLAMQQWIIR